jgi:hypothetical protein
MIMEGGLLLRENVHCVINESYWKNLSLHYRKIGLVTNKNLFMYKFLLLLDQRNQGYYYALDM